MRFEWDDAKAESNLEKHGVSFHEAATVFGDPLALTFNDHDHLREEQRFLAIGESDQDVVLMKAIEPGQQEADELRAEYDLSTLSGRARGKYAQSYRQGTNLVLLAPDVASAFPDEKAVNDALRKLLAQNSTVENVG